MRSYGTVDGPMLVHATSKRFRTTARSLWRMANWLPVFLCLIGTRTTAADKLFIGWFGPRGLATIVFAILVLDAKLPGNDTIMLAAGWTVLLSVIAHGVTANPLVRRMASRPSTQPEDSVSAAG